MTSSIRAAKKSNLPTSSTRYAGLLHKHELTDTDLGRMGKRKCSERR
jgi:hypothetical protein